MKVSSMHGKEKKLNRDQLLGQCLSMAISTEETRQECPSLEDIASLVDGTLPESKRDEIMGHVSSCETCYMVFCSVRDMIKNDSPRRISARIPFLAAFAAILLIAIAVVVHQSSPEKQIVADRNGNIVPETGSPSAGKPPTLIAKEERSQGGQKGPAPMTASEMAGMLVKSLGPGRLAARRDAYAGGTYGFVAAHDRSALAFRLGVSSIDLEIALLLMERESALAEVNRIISLVESLAVDSESIASLEHAREQLETEVPVEKIRGVTDALRVVLAHEQRLFLSFGQWCEAARIAAASGSGTFLPGKEFDDFMRIIPPEKVSRDKMKAVRSQLLFFQKKEPASDEFAKLEKCITDVIREF